MMGVPTDFRLCIRCRGARRLCGLAYCPLLVESRVSLTLGKVAARTSMDGSSPPSVFISWYDYPKVIAAIASPPLRGDTSHYERSEVWLKLNLSVDDLLTMRLTLIRGGSNVSIHDLSNKYVSYLQEVALAEKPVDVELQFSKPPKPKIELDELNPPIGPLAPVRSVRLGSNPYFGRYVEKVFNDTDMNAREAVNYLYRSGIEVSRIIRIFSVGGVGIGNLRRLVPTRWSITAVDKIISDELVNRIKSYEPLSEVLVFQYRVFDNAFMAVLIPSRTGWFEWMEAWFPGSTWNRFGSEVVIEGDWEGPQGRTTYPDIGGCYYASRLAVAEYLNRIRRKAIAVLMREIYPSFNIPIGVWFVRESLRIMFKQKPIKLSDVKDLIKVMNKFFKIEPATWIMKSSILKKFIKERSILEYLR
ncbi:MAG: hypothetical protein DRO18_01235 [Thermoprotei archaeon]|nr:MAG: hypothetical protein DRO18_01235 [Thermoprotei archaeon]